MDCITISTFRNLEQQAIRQHRERKINEAAYKGFACLHENSGNIDTKTTNTINFETSERKINYYA